MQVIADDLQNNNNINKQEKSSNIGTWITVITSILGVIAAFAGSGKTKKRR